VFLGTVGRLQAAMADAFTSGMSHAFVASVLICALAVVFSAVREGRRVKAPAAPRTTGVPIAGKR
jgi:hypothetical protein